MLKFATLVLVVVTLVEGDTPSPTHKILIIEAAIAGDFARIQALLNLHNELLGSNSLSREPPVSRQNLLPYSLGEREQYGVSSSEQEQPLNQVSFPVLIPANISILGQVLIPGKIPTPDQISGSTPIFLAGSNGSNASIKYNPTASNSRYQSEDTSGGVVDRTQFGNNNPLPYYSPTFNGGDVVISKPSTGDPIDSTRTLNKDFNKPYYPAILYQLARPIVQGKIPTPDQTSGLTSVFLTGSNSPNAYNPTASNSRYQPEDTSAGVVNNIQFGNNNPFNNSWALLNTGNVTNMKPSAGGQFDAASPTVKTRPTYYNPYKPVALNDIRVPVTVRVPLLDTSIKPYWEHVYVNTGNVTNMEPPAGGQFDAASPTVINKSQV
ncbi:hypothetical protein K1T71_002079 [Dendrolimus kikuchii]|uniref:Uncharacterized protein n=1 Tax=Dendrolimus kikuchii TaxID=765133 RepID=A0ACC1DFW8_9NEOP|nr:hypothetical protein K1T71_002079 [Dendrolimus kikuchii]